MSEEPQKGVSAVSPLAPEFVALLACPACADRPPLRLEESAGRLHCDRCGRVYPIIDGIPELIVEEGDAPEPAAGAPKTK